MLATVDALATVAHQSASMTQAIAAAMRSMDGRYGRDSSEGYKIHVPTFYGCWLALNGSGGVTARQTQAVCKNSYAVAQSLCYLKLSLPAGSRIAAKVRRKAQNGRSALYLFL